MVCYTKLNEIDTNKPQTIIDICNEGGVTRALDPNVLCGAYCLGIQLHELDHSKYLDHLEGQNIRDLWNDKKQKTIQTLRKQQKKEYDVWGPTDLYYEYNDKIKEIEELKL